MSFWAIYRSFLFTILQILIISVSFWIFLRAMRWKLTQKSKSFSTRVRIPLIIIFFANIVDFIFFYFFNFYNIFSNAHEKKTMFQLKLQRKIFLSASHLSLKSFHFVSVFNDHEYSFKALFQIKITGKTFIEFPF
jgi:hypothetical protein